MFNVKVAEGENKKARPYIRECLKKAAREGRIDAALCAGDAVDLLIMPRGASCGGGRAKCMLLAGGQKHEGSGKSVRCGLSVSDELTLSSIGRENALLSLQKDIVTLSGELLEQQEIAVSLAQPAEPEAVLAAAGAMLLLGADPGALKLS